jgi:probable phosphoglycerate mutase
VRLLILARHGEAGANHAGLVNGIPPGEGLTAVGREEADRLGDALARVDIDLAAVSEFWRTQETLDRALRGRTVTRLVLPLLNEIRFGAYDGGLLSEYRKWAWSTEADVRPPGAGESRAEVATRVADALDVLIDRHEETIVVVGHALPLRYILDAADGTFPAAKIEPVPHATPLRVDRDGAARAAETLRTWSLAPQFRDELDF